jgi:hypothetical protein
MLRPRTSFQPFLRTLHTCPVFRRSISPLHQCFNTGILLAYLVVRNSVHTTMNSSFGTSLTWRLRCSARTLAPSWPWPASLRHPSWPWPVSLSRPRLSQSFLPKHRRPLRLLLSRRCHRLYWQRCSIPSTIPRLHSSLRTVQRTCSS